MNIILLLSHKIIFEQKIKYSIPIHFSKKLKLIIFEKERMKKIPRISFSIKLNIRTRIACPKVLSQINRYNIRNNNIRERKDEEIAKATNIV